MISQENFYKNFNPKNDPNFDLSKIDFDHPDATDWNLLNVVKFKSESYGGFIKKTSI